MVLVEPVGQASLWGARAGIQGSKIQVGQPVACQPRSNSPWGGLLAPFSSLKVLVDPWGSGHALELLQRPADLVWMRRPGFHGEEARGLCLAHGSWIWPSSHGLWGEALTPQAVHPLCSCPHTFGCVRTPASPWRSWWTGSQEGLRGCLELGAACSLLPFSCWFLWGWELGVGTGVSEGDVTGPLVCAGRNQLLPPLGGPG